MRISWKTRLLYWNIISAVQAIYWICRYGFDGAKRKADSLLKENLK